ncbi:thioredoxin domain-containing protein [Glutamicibacter soli]|uniref:thioredoxin domain-containing protein n=1 Tax=Glutamicibacter soli TaxID=453836 RepID=UPI003FD0ACB3
MAQRLSGSSSQYLRQHAHQLVDWFPYGDQAFEQARLRDVPVMLSIGYSACHWCHVMSHESFDDPAIAQLLNEHFVAIKVDREEHPLVDDTYMMATQALTGAGGWPMTIFALPDGRAFHAGTYYPAVPRGKTPSFTQVLNAVNEAWETKRDGLAEQADMLAGHLAELGARQGALLSLHSALPAQQSQEAAVTHWISATRPEGGTTPAPKFPPTWALKTLWRSALAGGSRGDEAFNAAATTLEAILCGGLQDHLGGGFARYCVDEHWSVPHFEKMLYDNAGLLSLCARSAVLAGEYARGAAGAQQQRAEALAAAARAAALDTAEFLRREMRVGADGGGPQALASSLDADSPREGKNIEGAYYTFSRAELNAALDGLDALPPNLVRLAEVAEDPGRYCLSLARFPHAGEEPLWNQLKQELGLVRATRQRPGRDAKVIAGWNGLAIEALCEAGTLLDAPELLEMAEEAATAVWQAHWDPETRRLARVSFDGKAEHSNEGTLQDYAALALGLLALDSARGNGPWAARADALLGRAGDFIDPGTGVPRDAVQLDARLSAQRAAGAATVLDDAIPAAGALYAMALARRAVTAMADGAWTNAQAAGLERAGELTVHALALATEVPTQVATALEVQAVLNAPVQYATVGGAQPDQLARLRRLGRSMRLELREEKDAAGPAGTLRIQGCRKELCQAPVDSLERFVQTLHHH